MVTGWLYLYISQLLGSTYVIITGIHALLQNPLSNNAGILTSRLLAQSKLGDLLKLYPLSLMTNGVTMLKTVRIIADMSLSFIT